MQFWREPVSKESGAPLARKGDGLVVSAVVTMNTDEPICEYATIQKSAELSLDKSGNAPIVRAR
jgi:hypothetical protein